MSYYIYQTEGIILGKKDVGEADRIFGILTKEFGKIDAAAQGVRNLKSKLRYNLNILSHSRFGLVATKESWRIVDAEELNGWSNIRANPEKSAATSRIAELINRMVKGQESDVGLWNEVKNAFIFLERHPMLKSPTSDVGELRIFELLTNLKILSHLGYVEDHEKWLNISLDEAQKMEPFMVSLVDRALQESQL